MNVDGVCGGGGGVNLQSWRPITCLSLKKKTIPRFRYHLHTCIHVEQAKLNYFIFIYMPLTPSPPLPRNSGWKCISRPNPDCNHYWNNVLWDRIPVISPRVEIIVHFFNLLKKWLKPISLYRYEYLDISFITSTGFYSVSIKTPCEPA